MLFNLILPYRLMSNKRIQKNRLVDHSLNVPDFQVIPFIGGNGMAFGTKLVGMRGFGEAIIFHMDNWGA